MRRKHSPRRALVAARCAALAALIAAMALPATGQTPPATTPSLQPEDHLELAVGNNVSPAEIVLTVALSRALDGFDPHFRHRRLLPRNT